MAWARGLLLALLVLTALLLQTTALPLLGLPGAVPDLLTVTVVAVGWAAGPVRGAATGFAAGLALDLIPPADGLLGLSAVMLVVVGYFAGLLGASEDRPALVTVVLVAVLAASVVIGTAVVGTIVSDPRTSWERLPGLTLTQAGYAAVLAAFVVPLVASLWRRVDPPAPRYEVGRA